MENFFNEKDRRIGFTLFSLGLILICFGELMVRYANFFDQSDWSSYLRHNIFEDKDLAEMRPSYLLANLGFLISIFGIWRMFFHAYTTKKIFNWIKTGKFDNF